MASARGFSSRRSAAAAPCRSRAAALGPATPSWSPDGTEIAYFNVPIVNDTQRGRTQLAKRTVAGGAQDILYSLPGDADGAPAR